jgi:hypothetical protein
MIESDRARLVNLLTSTWPAGVKGYVWTDTLGPLDHALAHSAYVELRDHEDRPPSVARFVAAYHARRSARDAEREPPARCELCDGTGWVESPPERAHNSTTCHPTEERPCCCHAVEPCRCSNGRRNVAVAQRIHAENDRTKRHAEPAAPPPPRAELGPIAEELPL